MLNTIQETDFINYFDTEDKCLAFLANHKWSENSFICRHCGHHHYCKAKRPYGRRCTRCKNEESALVGTLFEGCRFPLPKAFYIAFAVCQSTSVSTHELARQLEIRQMTCWNFKQKVLDIRKKRNFDEFEIVNFRSIL